MNPLVHLLMASLISVILSALVLRVLSEPLLRVLSRLCPDEAAAAFWLTYTQVMLTMAPLLAVLLVATVAHGSDALSAVRLSVTAALVGLLAGLYTVGRRLAPYVRLTGAGRP